ncbi:MAG: hypothetical protein JWM76_5017 [Pseudonocardiales bacterium]|nr:hypothetical protein [Pseudonocardiales bacterium]
MDEKTSRRQRAANASRVEQIADLLDEVCAANGLLAKEVARASRTSSLVNLKTSHHCIRLADQQRPGSKARAALSTLDPHVVLAGTSVWMARHRARETFPASARASARWSGQASA